MEICIRPVVAVGVSLCYTADFSRSLLQEGRKSSQTVQLINSFLLHFLLVHTAYDFLLGSC